MSREKLFKSLDSSRASDERYTPKHIIDICRNVCGGFDLDPASCAEANEVVQAHTYFSQEDDGLTKEWHGNVWCNPPYSREAGGVKRWVEKAMQQMVIGNTDATFMLLNSNTSSKFFQILCNSGHVEVCFLSKRLKFSEPGGEVLGKPMSGSVLALISHNSALRSTFRKEIKTMGVVMINSDRK